MEVMGRTHKPYFPIAHTSISVNLTLLVQVYNPTIKCNLAHELAYWIYVWD